MNVIVDAGLLQEKEVVGEEGMSRKRVSYTAFFAQGPLIAAKRSTPRDRHA